MTARERTVTDHRERLNRVLLHIEAHIDQPLSLETLAAVACFSPFHFHRIFSAHVGETLNDHIRRLRLEWAARRLCQAGDPITSIALSAGYETPAAFTRAFREHFGENPTAYKTIKMQARREMLLPIAGTGMGEGGKPLEPDIRTLPEQSVLFVRKTGRYDLAASEAWGALMRFAYPRRLLAGDARMIGISRDDPEITPEARIRYDACITISEEATPEGEVGIQTLSGGRYAVFLHKGAYGRLGITYGAIFANWLPASGRKLRNLPHFEVYLNRDPRRTKPENLRTEIWLPFE